MERERQSFLWLFLYLIRGAWGCKYWAAQKFIRVFPLNTLQKILNKLLANLIVWLTPFHLFPLRWVTEDSLTGLLGAYPWCVLTVKADEWNPVCSVRYNFQFCCPWMRWFPNTDKVYMFAVSYLSATTTCMSGRRQLSCSICNEHGKFYHRFKSC